MKNKLQASNNDLHRDWRRKRVKETLPLSHEIQSGLCAGLGWGAQWLVWGSRGDHHHAATLPSRESSKAAYLGCHIYGKKWLAPSKVSYNGEVCMRHLGPKTL